jgi:hypothetical protein
MGNWAKQQEEAKESKEKNKVRQEKLASFFFDLSKITYTVLVVGLLVNVIQEQDFTNFVLVVSVVVGVLISIIFARIGNNILKK